MTQAPRQSEPFATALPAVLFVTAIFFCNFISRVVLAPLMPVVQADLGFTHAGAGHLFLGLAVGNAIGLFFSGIVSRAMNHRRTVGLSAVLIGICALVAPLAATYLELLLALFCLGLAVGLYLPSGIASVTCLVRKEDWGKTMAVHELAPNVSYVMAPLLAEAALFLYDWRAALYFLGALQVCIGIVFILSGRGSEDPGMMPGPSMIWSIARRPIFWLLVLMFSLGVGASIGPYSMLPLYLADGHGYSREEANHLLAISRVMACFAPFLAGWITDKWGAKPAILLYLVLNGSALVSLGFVSGTSLVTMVILQPVCSVILFAPGFTMLSMIFDPAERSVAVSLMGPVNAVVGLGVFPTFLGHMGDAGMFHVGFAIQGCLLLCAILFLPILPKGRAGE